MYALPVLHVVRLIFRFGEDSFIIHSYYSLSRLPPYVLRTRKRNGMPHRPPKIAVGTPLTLSNPIFLSTAYSPAVICFGRERGWWITCNYPTVLKEKNLEKQKEYNLRYLLAKVRTTRGKASDRLRQWANKRNKNRIGRLPTSERNR
jgi:hypothetical protein